MARRIDTVIEKMGVETPQQLEQRQAFVIRGNNQRWRRSVQVWSSMDHPSAFVGAGAWRVLCVCGEAPATHPEWRIARCAGCGAVYEGVIFPDNREEIEAVLVLRRFPMHRNWQEGITVDVLIRQNIKNGAPIPDWSPAELVARERKALAR